MSSQKPRSQCPRLFWLIHHRVILELQDQSIESRLNFIRNHKPRHERATRLEWLRSVKQVNKLPRRIAKLYAEFKAAWSKENESHRILNRLRYNTTAYWRATHRFQKARNDRSSKREALKRAIKAIRYRDLIDRRHRVECPGCPFNYKARTLIFN